MAASVKIDGLRKAFGHTRAVDDVSLAIEPGELFFLLGPSGCGKTTLLRSIAGFCEPDMGRIFLGDREISRLPAHERDTGMVFQSYALWPHLSVRDNVAFGLQMRKMPRREIRKRVGEMLELVRMEDQASARPNQLSGGQQQRVALARALVVHPQCLLLDEPLSNLDAKLRLEMRQEIRRICKQVGRTAVYVTHDQTEALSIADRIAVMNFGRIQQVGTPQDIYRRPASVFVADFIGETNLLQARIEEVQESFVALVCDAGSLVSSNPTQAFVQPGDEVTVSLRPEALHIGNPGGGGVNLLEGTIHHTVYLGESAQHRMSVSVMDAEGPTLKILELNPTIVAPDGREQSAAWIEPSDVVILEN